MAAWLLASRLRLRGLCPLAAGVFPGGMGKKRGGAVPLEGVALPVRWRLTGLPAAAPRALPACRRGFCWQRMGKKRGAAVPLEGGALSLWGIRPISEKEQSLPGKRACGPFPIHASLLF